MILYGGVMMCHNFYFSKIIFESEYHLIFESKYWMKEITDFVVQFIVYEFYYTVPRRARTTGETNKNCTHFNREKVKI